MLQTDWGGEYQTINNCCLINGILHCVPYSHIHEQNGAADHKHQHIIEKGLSLTIMLMLRQDFGMRPFLRPSFSVIDYILQ